MILELKSKAYYLFERFWLAFPHSTGKSKLFCIEFDCLVGTDSAGRVDKKVNKIEVRIQNNKEHVCVFRCMIK